TAGGAIPAGLRDEGFEVTEIVDLDQSPPAGGDPLPSGATGVISAVVLSYRSDVTLPPTGTATVLRVEVESRDPRGDEEQVGEIFCRDGLVGSGQPVTNFIVAAEKGGEICGCQRLRIELPAAEPD